ncbi:MAG: hypothetical protein WCG21_11610 [Eubacteriales bacterium]
MQTAKLIYLAMLILLVVPLIGFNIKRMSVKQLGAKRRIKWGVVIVIAALTIFISGFLFAAYKVTVDTRYELAAERYIDLHAEYVTGQITYDAYIAKTAPMRTADADTGNLKDTLATTDGTVKKAVRFQISSWIIPKHFSDIPSLPPVEVLDNENPVFLLYRFDDASVVSYYLIEMVWSDAGGWKIAYHVKASDDQVKKGESNLPSLKNGKWFYISG